MEGLSVATIKPGEYEWILLGDLMLNIYFWTCKANPETNITFFILGQAPYLKVRVSNQYLRL